MVVSLFQIGSSSIPSFIMVSDLSQEEALGRTDSDSDSDADSDLDPHLRIQTKIVNFYATTSVIYPMYQLILGRCFTFIVSK